MSDEIRDHMRLQVIHRLREEERVVYYGIRAYFSGIAFIRRIESSIVLDHSREITFMVISYICYYATATGARNSGLCSISNAIHL